MTLSGPATWMPKLAPGAKLAVVRTLSTPPLAARLNSPGPVPACTARVLPAGTETEEALKVGDA